MTDHPEGCSAGIDFELDGCALSTEVELLAPFGHATLVVRARGVETVAVSLSDPTGCRRLAEYLCAIVWRFGRCGGAA